MKMEQASSLLSIQYEYVLLISFLALKFYKLKTFVALPKNNKNMGLFLENYVVKLMI